MGTLRLTKSGITYKTDDSSVYLDPKKVHTDGINFVSHAHIDHLQLAVPAQLSVLKRLGRLPRFVDFHLNHKNL